MLNRTMVVTLKLRASRRMEGSTSVYMPMGSGMGLSSTTTRSWVLLGTTVTCLESSNMGSVLSAADNELEEDEEEDDDDELQLADEEGGVSGLITQMARLRFVHVCEKMWKCEGHSSRHLGKKCQRVPFFNQLAPNKKLT